MDVSGYTLEVLPVGLIHALNVGVQRKGRNFKDDFQVSSLSNCVDRGSIN